MGGNTKEIVGLIRELPLLRGYDDKSLEALVDESKDLVIDEGTRIIEYGTTGEFLGILLDGELVASKPGDGKAKALATMKPGSYFGEMALLTGELTSADVTATRKSRYLRIPQPVFARTLAANPLAVAELAKTLADRLRKRAEEPEEAHDETWKHATDPYGLEPEHAIGQKRALVINCGSSSLKYCFFDGQNPEGTVRGLVERIGDQGSRHKRSFSGGEVEDELPIPDHEAGLELVFEALAKGGVDVKEDPRCIDVVGHRVVHGGDRYSSPTIIDGDVISAIDEFSKLAPLHNPNNLKGIEVARKLLPETPQVAVFDTAYHSTVPEFAHVYGLPYAMYRESKLRRYGFHGPSHNYVSLKAATFLRKPIAELKLITCHLGSGASVCAIDHGRSVDTSMGFSPLEGLMMGTRSGDIDPGIVIHMIRDMGMSVEQVEDVLTHDSGLRGISGMSGDMREIMNAADEGEHRSLLAVRMYAYRVKKYIGAYSASLGGVDAIIFTGGIGENSAGIRARILQGMDRQGIVVDEMRNQKRESTVRAVSAEGSRVKVLVVPTDEELMIARESIRAMGHDQVTDIIQTREKKAIPVEVSAHHVHLCRADVDRLFGEGYELTRRSDLSQPGQYACNETVNLVGPRGRVEKVRILGPMRRETQIEISRTEEFKLGIDAPIRASGDLDGTPGLTLEGPKGSVTIEKGVICAMRHIHMHPEDALAFGIHDRDVVLVRVGGERTLIFGDVLVRVNPNFRLAMHLDTDEANAAEISKGDVGFIESIQNRPGPQKRSSWAPTSAS